MIGLKGSNSWKANLEAIQSTLEHIRRFGERSLYNKKSDGVLNQRDLYLQQNGGWIKDDYVKTEQMKNQDI